jgi:hypothetical protein
MILARDASPASANIGAGQAKKRSIYGDINFGYSNYGVACQGSINYRSGRKLLSLAGYKSHVCVLNNDKGVYFPESESVDKHTTITSLSLSGGVVFRGRFRPTLSCGISLLDFTYERTEHETHVMSLPSVWATFTGAHYQEVVLESSNVMTIGMPVEFRMHFVPKGIAGLDIGFRTDLNPEKVFATVFLGLRLGRL